MQDTKLKSFTLSEMLVVLIITAIVVGMAFSVLGLVQKQIRGIEKNFGKTTDLALLEQQLWQDFNGHNSIGFQNEKITLISAIDTVQYVFKEGFVLRNNDTIDARLKIDRALYDGTEVKSGSIDAISVSATELPDYMIFVYSQSDATLNMNQDGI